MVFFNLFQSSNSQTLGKKTCFNMFQYVFPMFQSYFPTHWGFPPGCFSWLFPQILYSGLFVRFAWAVQPRNYILASCPETQWFFPLKISWGDFEVMVFVWGKMMMNPIFVGKNIHVYDVPTNSWTPPWTSTKVTPPMSWPRATSFGGRSWSVFRVHVGGLMILIHYDDYKMMI